MIKLPNGLYRISNKKTGQTKDVAASDLKKYGLSAPGSNDLIPQIAGGVGGTIGQAIGTPFDLVSGPAGTMTGGAIGGGLAQGGAQAVENLLTGQPVGQNVAGETGQGAAFGAIPGVEEARTAELGGEVAAKTGVMDSIKNLVKSKASTALTGKSLAKRAALRAGTGAVGGGVAQAVKNLQQGNPVGQNVGKTATETGATNMILPGVTQEGGNYLRNLMEGLNQRAIGGPISKMQELFDQTASHAVGDYPLDYAMSKGIIPSNPDETGKLKPQGLMTNEYIDSAISKRKTVAADVEKQLQALLPSQKERPVTQDEIKPFIDNFIQQNYAGESGLPIKGKSAMNSFINDIQRFGGKTASSDPISTQDVIDFLKGGVNKRLDTGTGSVGLANQLKRIAGRGYNEKNPTAWTGLYNDLRDFVEKNSKDPVKVGELNNEHAKLRMMRISLNKFKQPGAKFPIPPEQATAEVEHARFGPTIGLSAERAMPVPLLLAQGGAALGGAALGYHVAGGLGAGAGAVAPYLLAGQAREIINHLSQNPQVSESIADQIKKGTPLGQALQSLLQQQTVRQPIQQQAN